MGVLPESRLFSIFMGFTSYFGMLLSCGKIRSVPLFLQKVFFNSAEIDDFVYDQPIVCIVQADSGRNRDRVIVVEAIPGGNGCKPLQIGDISLILPDWAVNGEVEISFMASVGMQQ
jgi:hypothetical protein